MPNPPYTLMPPPPPKVVLRCFFDSGKMTFLEIFDMYLMFFNIFKQYFKKFGQYLVIYLVTGLKGLPGGEILMEALLCLSSTLYLHYLEASATLLAPSASSAALLALSWLLSHTICNSFALFRFWQNNVPGNFRHVFNGF